MKIIPVSLDWAKIWLPLLWSQRVCINTWLHAKGLSQTSFWKFSSLPPKLFFSMMVANSLVSARGSAENKTRTQRSVRSFFSVFSEDISSLFERLCTSIGCWSPGPASQSSLHYRLLPGCTCTGSSSNRSTPPPSVLNVYFIHMVTQAVSNPAGETEDFHISASEHMKCSKLSQHERSCSLKAAYLYWNISAQAVVIVQQHVLFIWAHVSFCTAWMVLLFWLFRPTDEKNVGSHGGFDASMLLKFTVGLVQWRVFQ